MKLYKAYSSVLYRLGLSLPFFKGHFIHISLLVHMYNFIYLFIISLLTYLWPRHVAGRISVSRPGIEPGPQQ